jgi:hypothetical protein
MRFTVILVTLLLISTGSLYALDQTGLVLYLPFDEWCGKSAKDASDNGNDGELMGNVEWVGGQYGKAVRILDDDAGNMVVVKDSDTLDITGEMTIAAWINIETLPDENCSIVTKADTYMVHASTWSGLGIEMELLLWPFDAWQTAASTPIQFNEWRHYVGIYDGAEIRTYIDGELKGQRARTGDTDVTAADVVIGRDSRDCCNTRLATLTMDEVMMWNRVLSDSEVREVMASLAPVQPQDLLAATWGRIKARF